MVLDAVGPVLGVRSRLPWTAMACEEQAPMDSVVCEEQAPMDSVQCEEQAPRVFEDLMSLLGAHCNADGADCGTDSVRVGRKLFDVTLDCLVLNCSVSKLSLRNCFCCCYCWFRLFYFIWLCF